MNSFPGDPDILVIGAGAAGIAAARAIQAAGRSVAVLEARPRPGGRAWTNTETLGAPYDLGATWLHCADENPLVGLAARQGVTLIDSDAVRREHTRIGRRAVTARQDAAYLAAWAAMEARIEAAAAGPDVSLAAGAGFAGPWGPTMAQWQGDIISAAPVARISLRDFHANALVGGNRLPEHGLGAFIVALAAGLPIRLAAPVTRLAWGGSHAVAEGPFGTIRARAVIATLPTSLLAADALRFDPPLPPEVMQAAHDLPLGTVAKAGFRVVGEDRLGLAPFTSCDRRVTADESLVAMSFWAFGRPILSCHVGGDAAAGLEREGDAAVEAFIRGEIAVRFGVKAARLFRPGALVSSWLRDPWSRGVYSYARIGCAGARAILATPLAEGRLCLAGEACDIGQAGTVGGAWRSGEAAAKAALATLG